MEIFNYADFTTALLEAGFSMGGGNASGIFSLISWDWNQEPPYETPVRWHTGDLESDPWEWRMRVLDERDDIAYASCFLKRAVILRRNGTPVF